MHFTRDQMMLFATKALVKCLVLRDEFGRLDDVKGQQSVTQFESMFQ